MSFLVALLSPFNLLFFIVIAGLAVGKLRIYRISLGIAGVLFVSIIAGVLMNHLVSDIYTETISDIQSTMKAFSTLGTSLFVSVIGLQTGFSIKNNSKSSMIAFLIGVLMSVSGVVVMLIVSVLDKTISYSTLLGVLCGALTSTPGLSGVCELVNGEEAVWGYSCAYFVGVLSAVLFAQLFVLKIFQQNTTQTSKNIAPSKISPDLILICLTALLGNVICNAFTHLLSIPLGSTACILLIGLIIGFIVKKKLNNIQISLQVLNSFRTLGLALFFVGTGFSTGMQSMNFNVRTVLYGTIISLTAILFGLILCKFLFSRYQLNTSFVIAGGMTSSPAYGSISAYANEVDINYFSFAYFGALISLITAIQIIGR